MRIFSQAVSTCSCLLNATALTSAAESTIIDGHALAPSSGCSAGVFADGLSYQQSLLQRTLPAIAKVCKQM